MNKIKFIDLFAGLGGIRLGFENAFKKAGFQTECVMTSEIKKHAVESLRKNFPHELLVGDITAIHSDFIPDFDFLLAGFPCQPFSSGGRRFGFQDTRGTLFFEIERILKEKQPKGFILENVEGLVKHDLENKTDKIGNTLKVIIDTLENKLNYKVSWKVLDSVDFGLAQSRKRIYIVGTKNSIINLNNFKIKKSIFKDIMESQKSIINSEFTTKLLSKYTLKSLHGKSIKDKRGGANNIHSWDIGLKGDVSEEQTLLLSKLFKARRQKKWAEEIGINWMDGMPLTLEQIKTFCSDKNLRSMLDDLVSKGYLKLEHPKKLVSEVSKLGLKKYRTYDITLKKGYNIVTGKLSFEFNKILNPNDIVPTLVATDVSRLAVPDGLGLRKLTIREGLRLFGYPDSYEIPCNENEGFDLLGNTVAVPIINEITKLFINFEEKEELTIPHLTSNSIPV
jgi:DNA (cytosine-5)-methyltransferase 1